MQRGSTTAFIDPGVYRRRPHTVADFMPLQLSASQALAMAAQ